MAEYTLLVTGGCGFIPSNFINYILEEQSSYIVKVINYDLLLHTSSKSHVSPPPASSRSTPYIFVAGDIRNKKLLEQTLRQYNVDTVVHFAALTHVCDSYVEPLEYVKTNVEGTVSLLEACQSYGHLKRFVYISTDEVYGDSLNESTAKTERDCLKPTNPYSASKASAEHFVEVYFKSYAFPAVVVRMCNVYGPHQGHDKVVPNFINLARQDKPFTIQGDGSQVRNWLHVSDACRAIFCAVTNGKVGEIYNIGSSNEVSILALAKEVQMAVHTLKGGSGNKMAMDTVSIPDRPYNDQRYHMDATKLKAELGWKESVSFKQGLKETVSWYLQKQPTPDRERILIYGAKGWIGGQFVDLLNKEGIEYIVGEKRLGDDPDEDIEQEVLSVAPTHVASFIGRTHGPGNSTVGYLEGGPDKLTINMRDNLFGPLLLAEICRKFNIHFTYIGSGCIFKYTEEHSVGGKPYTEDDRPNFFGSSYSVVKGYTDRLMHQYKNVLNVRMRLPISADNSPRNLITKLVSYKKIMNVPNSVSVLPELLPALLEMMKHRQTGTINLVNHGCADHTDILEEYRSVVEPSHDYVLISETDSSDLAEALRSTRSNCYLSTNTITQIAPQVSSAKEAVKKIMQDFKLNDGIKNGHVLI